MKKVIVCISMFIYLAVPSFAESIGAVDMQKVFMSYNETQKSRADFEKKQQELKEEIEKKQGLLEKAQKENKKPEEIEKIIQEIQDELKPKQDELIGLNNQLMAKIQEDILKSTKKVAKAYGIDIVVNKQALLHGGFDLTDFVIDDLNQ